MSATVKTKPKEPDAKNHDAPIAETQAKVSTTREPDKIGSPSKDSEAGRAILQSASKPGTLHDGPNTAGLEGSGHSTHHVTGMPEAAEKAFPKAKPAPGKAVIGTMVTYREADYEVSAAGGGTNPQGTNGTREHPAIITRVWSNDCVNLTVFKDMNHTHVRASVMKLGVSQDEAPPGVQVGGGNGCWY